MRILFYVFFSMITALPCYAQQSYSDLLLKNYQHTITYEDHKITFHTQDELKKIASLSPNKYYHWFANQQLKITQGGYSGKLLHGIYTDFYPNNYLKEKGLFKEGLKNGEWKHWTNEGKLTAIYTYHAGLLEGPFFKYDKNGILTQRGNYHNDQIKGKLRTYVNPDSVVVTTYKHGVLQPTVKKESWFKSFFHKKKSKE